MESEETGTRVGSVYRNRPTSIVIEPCGYITLLRVYHALVHRPNALVKLTRALGLSYGSSARAVVDYDASADYSQHFRAAHDTAKVAGIAVPALCARPESAICRSSSPFIRRSSLVSVRNSAHHLFHLGLPSRACISCPDVPCVSLSVSVSLCLCLSASALQ